MRPGADPFTVELLPRDAARRPWRSPSGCRSSARSTARARCGSSSPRSPGRDARPCTCAAPVRTWSCWAATATVARGTDLPAGRGGVALVHHEPGSAARLAGRGGRRDGGALARPDDESRAGEGRAAGERAALRPLRRAGALRLRAAGAPPADGRAARHPAAPGRRQRRRGRGARGGRPAGRLPAPRRGAARPALAGRRPALGRRRDHGDAR